jgi:methylase of polypeptide subunit release factors
VRRIVLPGEWYLVRWGGTRKGSGTFYTRPGLAVPTVQRALQPLAYERLSDNASEAGEPKGDLEWQPKSPEAILALKVCDPACGSGSFLVATLRYLVDALHASLHVHGRVRQQADRAIIELLGKGGKSELPDALGSEMLPCPPDDPSFEARLRAVLRRHVVERCVYGVDLDPLAVELCRLSLWIETMDRTLPFSFLDHKLRPGDGLVGTWLDRFRDYPLMAWWRESPDDTSKNRSLKLAHHEAKTWHEALKARKAAFLQEQAEVIKQQQLISQSGISDEELEQALANVRGLYDRLHAVPPSRPNERARIWREEVLGNTDLQKVRAAFDLWSALWFWPLNEVGHAPGPTDLATPDEKALEIAGVVARQRRFFHWELEFPDVFMGEAAGFDAIVGNPPWEIQKPSSKEFFSNLDPLYRSYGKQDGLKCQRALFAQDAGIEQAWLEYVGSFKDKGNFVRHSDEPFGAPRVEGGDPEAKLVPRKLGESLELHRRWAASRAKRRGHADARHPFRHQGSADLNSYKLFVEQAHALLREGGQLALITPSGLYTDKGSVELRRLLLDHCSWRWLYGFENRQKVFDIDSRFKFAATIATKGGKTDSISAAFMRHDLADWSDAKGALAYPAERVHTFSPKSLSVLEIRDDRDLEVLTKIYKNSVLLGDEGPDGWGIRYATEFHMTNDSKLFIPREKAEADGYRADEYGRWIGPDGDVLLPLYQGAMLHQHDYAYKGWLAVDGKSPGWVRVPNDSNRLVPKFLVARDKYAATSSVVVRVGFRDIARATDQRTMIAGLLPAYPCGNKVPFLTSCQEGWEPGMVGILNSLVFDWAQRIRQGSTSLNYFIIEESPLLSPEDIGPVVKLCEGLGWSGLLFAPYWWIRHRESSCAWQAMWAVTKHERLRLRCIVDAVVAAKFGLGLDGFRHIARDCDIPLEALQRQETRRSLDPRGFWRVDRGLPPERRSTVLALIAFEDLHQHIDASEGDVDGGVCSFLAQNDGEGWVIPDTLRLADYALGRDERAQQHQPVASCLGPRFLDWQSNQSAMESWGECERHARAMLGDSAFERLRQEAEDEADVTSDSSGSTRSDVVGEKTQRGLFGELPVARRRRRR